jgi:RNA polymerase sigma factor (sigma-70 family)
VIADEELKKLTEELQLLVIAHLGMALRIAKRWSGFYPRLHDDIESAAVYGLLRGVTSYDCILGKPVRPWISFKVRSEIGEAIREYKKWVAIRHSDQEIEQLDPHTYEGDTLNEIFKFLPEPHRTLCALVYQSGFSLQDASEKTGISKSRATKIHNESLQILRRFFVR